MAAARGTTPTPILVERRFPLDLDATAGPIRALYEAAKAGRWDPYRDVDYAAIGAIAAPEPARAAARLAYSRRAWTEYTGLSETPAVLIRFCLEPGREADPKYFLAVRNTEEAWHIECFSGAATAFGGTLDAPANGAFAALFNQRRHTAALDANRLLDAYVAVFCAFEEELELRLAEMSLANATAPALAAMWQRIVADKRRHAEFGWQYIAIRGPAWTPGERAEVAATLRRFLDDCVGAGYHCVALAAPGTADELAAAEATAAAAGLGAVDAAGERAALSAALSVARERLGRYGVQIAAWTHPRGGVF